MRGMLLVFAGLAGFGATAARTADASGFDGAWAVTLNCPASPDGAMPFTFRFAAQVSGGRLHGENGLAGTPGWMSLDGPIQPDGTAVLDASGVTGRSAYNIHSTGAGVAYHHSVSAHFDADRGAGQWVTTRTCDFAFTRP
jgi:hypothetical protein